MNIFRRNPDFTTLCALVRLYSKATKSHYEVLNLRRNCTDKEIRNAFIRMSKEFHPDKNKDSSAQEKFVRVLEAYNVLGKPGSRAQYDAMTVFQSRGGSPTSNIYQNPHVYRTHYYDVRQPPNYANYGFYQESTHEDFDHKSSKQKSYYGVGGVNKVPNYVVIAICFGMAFVGLLLQMFVIRESFLAHRNQLYEKSRKLSEELERVEALARENGNEVQTQLLLEKIANAANHNAATANMGQALATANK